MLLKLYKIICLTLILSVGTQVLIAQPYAWNQLSLDFSPSPLDLRVGARGDIQIWRAGSSLGHLYYPFNNSFGVANGTCSSCWWMFNGIFMNVGSDTYITRTNASDNGFTDVWVGGVSDISGAGTIADPWQISADYQDSTNGDYGFNMVYSYINGTEYLDVEMTPFVPNGNTEIIKVYHILDTYLDGFDTGPAYTSGTAPYDLVGVLAPDGSIFEAFVATDDPWDRYGSHDYFDLLNEPLYDQELSNTLDTDPDTDNAIAVQWTLGVVTGVQPTIRYRIGFTADIGSIIGCEKSYINKHIGRRIKASGG